MTTAVLIGPPAAGKSTVGALLAARLGVEFADTDDLVAERAGRPIAAVLRECGGAAFRQLECDVVERALGSCPGVLSLGGGAALHPSTRDRLAGHEVVLLTVGLGTAMRRMVTPADRPLLDGPDPGARYRALLTERMPTYRAVCTHTVATDHLDPEAVVDLIADRLTVLVGGTR